MQGSFYEALLFLPSFIWSLGQPQAEHYVVQTEFASKEEHFVLENGAVINYAVTSGMNQDKQDTGSQRSGCKERCAFNDSLEK